RGELEATTISDITEYTTQVKGSAEPNAKIELKNGNAVIATGTVGSDGKYSLTISKQPAGSTIVAVVTLDGKTSQASTVVKEGQTKGTITAEEYQLGTGDGRVHGSFTGDVEWLRLEVNGNLYAWSNVTSSPFKYYAADKIKKATDKVYIVAYDKNKKELDRKQVLIKEAVQGTVTPNNYQIGSDNYLRGTYTGDVDSLKLLVNGKLYAKSTVSGSPFKYYVADKIKKATDQVYIIAYDRNGKELDRKPVTVKEPEVTINLKVDSYAVGGVNKYVEGSFSGTGLDQVSYIRLEVNDILYQRTDKFVNNTFTYYASDKIKATSDEAYIVAYDV
ncbi:hypothetical protein H6227_002575, partial [Enterococcus faecalis]|nr:hypothetical protein [Enterococcus faecalis]